jgi:alkanesulfonate monooxygenase SsuD/methylene tetrahydromethanopterin reductase-like flavin-dependent oxidoreductase (luciferase family)
MTMRSPEIGLVLPMGESFVDGATIGWSAIRDLAVRAEEIGFDTVWTADELLWRPEGGRTQGWWECVAMTGAVAAATSRIKVGTWILSALHRNPGITAKAVETLDEISGGRFVFGLGAGHAGRQGHAFGLPEDRTVGRFEEALEIILPLLREGRADFEGTFHAARDLEHRPVGPRPGAIPIMIGAKGPRMLRLAARHADIWSWFVEERSDIDEFAPRLAALESACAEVGRDPATIGRSAGIVVEPTAVSGAAEALAAPIRGSAVEIADRLLAFSAAGFDHLEILPWPPTIAALDAMAPVLELLDAGRPSEGRPGAAFAGAALPAGAPDQRGSDR